jgi:hypothetical protein
LCRVKEHEGEVDVLVLKCISTYPKEGGNFLARGRREEK